MESRNEPLDDLCPRPGGTQRDDDSRMRRMVEAALKAFQACEAALAYDQAIQEFSKLQNLPSSQDDFRTREGASLDDLYESWVSKARVALNLRNSFR